LAKFPVPCPFLKRNLGNQPGRKIHDPGLAWRVNEHRPISHQWLELFVQRGESFPGESGSYFPDEMQLSLIISAKKKSAKILPRTGGLRESSDDEFIFLVNF
jgi:hypothetical protein